MISNKLIIKGAKENNLKNISLELEKNKLIVFTGVSGSGKSSLAFNTIYEEGRRRYIDSLSSYAKQFLGGTKKPDVQLIEGLSPSISIEQKTTHNNPRSTVGTITEIYDYLRLLYARVGTPFCPVHHEKISSQRSKDIINDILSLEENSSIVIISPIIKGQKGTHKKLFEKLILDGFLRIKINNKIFLLDEEITLEKNKKSDISIIVDRIILKKENRQRISEAISLALEYSGGLLEIENLTSKKIKTYSQLHACSKGDFQMPKIETRLFSFNSPYGMCNECKGIGSISTPDIDLIILDRNLTINEGAISFPTFNIENRENLEWKEFEVLLKFYKIDKNKPINKFTDDELEIIEHGSKEEINFELNSRGGNKFFKLKKIEGIYERLERKYLNTSSEGIRAFYKKYMSDIKCSSCQGMRLNKYALAVKLDNKNIYEYCSLSIEEALKELSVIKKSFTKEEKEISLLITNEISNRLTFLKNVGLDYIGLNRISETLSGGEAQRIRLATQIGSKLSGVIYVLDEPSIGLHQSDNEKLIKSLKEMVNLGNTLIVVEHDEETILAADYIVDIGPLAGEKGGEIVAIGKVKDIEKVERSLTGNYLSGKRKIEVPTKRRKGNKKFIEIIKATENNLKNVSVKIPLGIFIVISGVSGSGKSSLINEVLVKGIENKINKNHQKVGKYQQINGIENIDKIIKISQSPIGRTPRSNPATYTSVFDDIRDLFAKSEVARTRGYNKGRFSFNVNGGRCDKCNGNGTIKIEMHFLPDVYIKCNHCDGKRYNYETLEVKYKNKNIADVLDMNVSEAIKFFKMNSKIIDKLQILEDVGLGYIKLGQAATTFSGGEAQRIKLATHLQKKATGKTIFVLDEPTTGLHIHDVKNLLNILNRIVDKGDTVLVIEHNLDVIKSADYIIDLGYGGGVKGGEIIAKGSPEEVVKNKKSLTGIYLKKYLN